MWRFTVLIRWPGSYWRETGKAQPRPNMAVAKTIADMVEVAPLKNGQAELFAYLLDVTGSIWDSCSMSSSAGGRCPRAWAHSGA